MFMPAVFHENLFDDLFDPFWNDGALERAMNREERETFGKRGANMNEDRCEADRERLRCGRGPAGLQEGRRSDGTERRLPDHSGRP